MATELAKAYVQIVPSAQGLTGSLTSLMSGEGSAAGDAAGKKAGSAFGATLKKTLVGIGIGKILMDSLGNTSEFETGMAKVKTLFTGTSEEFASLQNDILGLSSAYGISTHQLTEAAYSAESAGVSQANLVNMLESSARLAQAGFTDLDTALSATAKTMNAYGEAAGSAEDVQRVLMQTQNLGITTVGELGQSLAQVTPTAAAMGVSFDQVGAAMAQLTAAGVPTAQATTQLRAAMTELGKAGTKADLAFRAAAKDTEYAGMSFQEAMAAGADLGDVFGLMQAYADKSGKSMVDLWGSVEAGNAAMLISSDVDTFNRNLSEMSTTADVVGDAYETMANTFGTSMNKLKESAKNFMTTLFQGGDISASFDALLDGLGDVGGKLMGWIQNGLTTLGENLPKMMASLIDFGAGLLDALAQVDWVTVGTTLINGVIGALGTLGVKLMELFSNAIESLANGDVDFGAIGEAIYGGVTSIITTAGDWLKKLFDTAVGIVTKIDFSGIGTAILDGIHTILDVGGQFLSTLFGFGKEAAEGEDYSSIGQAILDGINSVLDSAGKFFGDIFKNGLEAAEGQDWPSLGETIKTAVNLALNGGKFLGAAFEAGADLIRAIDWKAVGEHASDLITSGLDNARVLLDAFTKAADDLVTSIGWKDIGQSITGLVTEGLDVATQLVNAVGEGADKLISGIQWGDIGEGISDVLVAGLNGAEQLVTTVSNAADRLLTSIKWEDIGTSASNYIVTGFNGVTGLMEDAFSAAHDFMAGIDWSDVGSKIQSGLGSVWSGLTDFIGGGLSGAGATLEGAGNLAGSGLNWLADLISGGSDLQKSAEEIKSAMKEMKKAVDDGKEDLKASAKEVGEGIVTSLKDELEATKMAEIGNNVIDGIKTGMTAKLVDLSQSVDTIKTAVKTSFEGKEGIWTKAGNSIISSLADGMTSNSSTLSTKIEEIINTAASNVKPTRFTNVGASIITGIISGINSFAYLLDLRIAALAAKISQVLQNALKIGSPSKVMRDSIGRWIPAGIAEGIDEYAYLVGDSLNNVAGDMTSNQLRTALMEENSGAIRGGLAVGVAGTDAGDLNEVQIALLREQNSLLRGILEKDTSVRIGPSVELGRTAKRSMEMYGLVGG